MRIKKNKLVGFKQIAEMLKAKSKKNKSKYIYFEEKDMNKYLSPVAIEILTKGV
jgi:hypothetical protein|tara:strand:+ start:264 stop:425 length:162 start_codon:yes stop_codon:yes gene_type:complete